MHEGLAQGMTTPPSLPSRPHPHPGMCSYCLEAHARAGMLVDTQRLKEMLLAVLPDALKGAPVADLAPRLPWPAATKNRTSVLWWA